MSIENFYINVLENIGGGDEDYAEWSITLGTNNPDDEHYIAIGDGEEAKKIAFELRYKINNYFEEVKNK